MRGWWWLGLLLLLGCPGGDDDAADDDAGDDDGGDDDGGDDDGGDDDGGDDDGGDDDGGDDDGGDDDGGDDDGGDDDDTTAGWLYTDGNRLMQDGAAWHGRGANLHDTRSCWACSWSQPDVAEVQRRLDELIDVWGANFVRLDLESYATKDPWMVQWQGVLDDPAYLADVVAIVDHIGTKPGVYVLLSLWHDGTFATNGYPTSATNDVWTLLAETFRDDAHVLYGLCNEPQYNFGGEDDPVVWQAMDDAVAAIRAVEDQHGTPYHVVAVQGTGGWARRLDYYVDHPIQAGGGENVAYEVHVYNPAADFQEMVTEPAKTLPVIIGEYGPAQGHMTMQDCEDLVDLAMAQEIPHLAWTFHHCCPPNLLVDHSGGCGCGSGMKLEPSEWGDALIASLAQPW